MRGTTPDTITQREREEFDQQKIMSEMQSAHTIQLKQLDIEVAKIEARWTAIFRLPVYIIMLPIRFLFGIAYIVSIFTKTELPNSFWDFMKW